ncbi:MAG: hypothetical protein KIT87_26960 [Anaerolineae bacterium]|nr:hypothetical protein [Anaerolineae bacterium]
MRRHRTLILLILLTALSLWLLLHQRANAAEEGQRDRVIAYLEYPADAGAEYLITSTELCESTDYHRLPLVLGDEPMTALWIDRLWDDDFPHGLCQLRLTTPLKNAHPDGTPLRVNF